MSFGFGVGDFLAVGRLALAVYNQCECLVRIGGFAYEFRICQKWWLLTLVRFYWEIDRVSSLHKCSLYDSNVAQGRGCSGQYRELSSDAGTLALTLSNLEDLDKKNRLDDSKRRELFEHGQACKQVLLDIREVLEKYESLSTKSKKIHDMLGWDYEGARELRDRLTANVVMLSAFYNALTASSIFRLEDAMNRMMRQIKIGQKSADSISILTASSVENLSMPKAWRLVISDLEDLGISAEDAHANRAFIVQWFSRALDEVHTFEPHTSTAQAQASEGPKNDQLLARHVGDGASASQDSEHPLLHDRSDWPLITAPTISLREQDPNCTTQGSRTPPNVPETIHFDADCTEDSRLTIEKLSINAQPSEIHFEFAHPKNKEPLLAISSRQTKGSVIANSGPKPSSGVPSAVSKVKDFYRRSAKARAGTPHELWQRTRTQPRTTSGPASSSHKSHPPSKFPVPTQLFGVSLEYLSKRDGIAVPMIVTQCIQAVDVFGLNVPDIYLRDGSESYGKTFELRFDKDAHGVNFTHPSSFDHDINNVTTVLKRYLSNLSRGLFTPESFQSFSSAVFAHMHYSAIARLILELPEPHRATLKALVLHLVRVVEHNKDNLSKLASCFGPICTGALGGIRSRLQDHSDTWSARVVEILLTFPQEIFGPED